MYKKLLICIIGGIFGFIGIANAAIDAATDTAAINTSSKIVSTKSAATQPKAFAYWAGWTNAEIPDFNFNGVLLAFAQLKGHYYTDYSASGNFEEPSSSGPYATWNTWLTKWFSDGARAFVSYGGATNSEFRKDVINASDAELGQIAGEIQANIKKYYFGGVDLDIEDWWDYNYADNIKFANNLAKLVIDLRQALDNDPATQGKVISIAVGWDSAGSISSISAPGSNTGSMVPFYQNSEAMAAVSYVYIMSYLTKFYSNFDNIGLLMNKFIAAGAPREKLMFGIEPYSNGRQMISLTTTKKLGEYIKTNNYGGMFMWGIGTDISGKFNTWNYMDAMMQGLGLR